MAEDPAAFVRANTAPQRPPLVPELELFLASETVPLWKATEGDLSDMGVPAPYWAFAWAGGQALARYLLDNPDSIAGKRVLDFASGSGLAAIAAAKTGAAAVTASEIDRFAMAAIRRNAAHNRVTVAAVEEDMVGRRGDWDIVLAGDICYEKPLAERVMRWLRDLAASGVPVLLGDPGRAYLPKGGLERVARYAVETTREMEDSDVRNAVVWRVLADMSVD